MKIASPLLTSSGYTRLRQTTVRSCSAPWIWKLCRRVGADISRKNCREFPPSRSESAQVIPFCPRRELLRGPNNSLLVEQRDVFGLRRGRHRFQKGVNVSNLLVGDDLGGVRRHIAGGRVNV